MNILQKFYHWRINKNKLINKWKRLLMNNWTVGFKKSKLVIEVDVGVVSSPKESNVETLIMKKLSVSVRNYRV